jgi:putative FmdB family regulatory protein
MALYEYKCPDCSEISTISRSITEPETNPECKACNVLLNRVYSSNVGVTFRGSGFYSTDK